MVFVRHCAHLQHVCSRVPDFVARINTTDYAPIYGTCAVVGSSGHLIHADFGDEIDQHDAVIRINIPPVGRRYHKMVGSRTTWLVMTMDEYSRTERYPQRWLKTHPTMEGIPTTPKIAVSCHWPFNGRCTPQRLPQIFHNTTSVRLVSPTIVHRFKRTYFQHVEQKSFTTGSLGLLFARHVCDAIDVYGYSDGRCPHACYHYYDCRYTEKWFYASMNASAGFHDFKKTAEVTRTLEREWNLRRHPPPAAECPP